MIALFFTNFWYAPYQVLKKLNIKFYEYYQSIISKIILPVLFMITSIFYLNEIGKGLFSSYVIIISFFSISILSVISLDQNLIFKYIKKYYLKLF